MAELGFAPFGPAARCWRNIVTRARFDKKVKLWQASSGRELLTFPEQMDRVRWLAFSPDGAMLATAGHDGILKIYRADRKK
jgi:WD40 repeat protein